MFAIMLALAVVAGPGVAWAGWNSPGTGAAFGKAFQMPTGATPTVSVTGRNVAVSWTAATFPDSTPVNASLVERYDAAVVAQGVGAACSGTIAGLTCTEAAVPPGTWTYTVTPKHHAWLGTESARSTAVTVAPPSLTLTPPTALATLPGTLTVRSRAS